VPPGDRQDRSGAEFPGGVALPEHIEQGPFAAVHGVFGRLVLGLAFPELGVADGRFGEGDVRQV
jgi:hypothetical protein